MDLFDQIWDFIVNFYAGLYELLKDIFEYLLTALAEFFFAFAQLATETAWEITSALLEELNISDHIVASWTAMPLEVRQISAFFYVPEILNNLLSYLAVKVVIKLVPFI